ncbi:MAG: hypothetical protein ACLQOO_05900, partial [Terriglobia bacterium]
GILEGEEETRVPRVRVPNFGWTGVVSMWCASSPLDAGSSFAIILQLLSYQFSVISACSEPAPVLFWLNV